MDYQIEYRTFACEYRNNYDFNFSNEIPQRDKEILKSVFISRNRNQGFYSKKYILKNIENLVFLVLKEGAVLFSCINSNATNKGITRYFGIYISNHQLETAWYFMDNIIYRFIENIDCFDKNYFSESELFCDYTNLELSSEFIGKIDELKKELLCNNLIRSFSIGFQLNEIPFNDQMAIYNCENVSSNKNKKKSISFNELREMFRAEGVGNLKNNNVSILVWKPNKLKVLYDKEYRKLYKSLKKSKKEKKICIWDVNMEQNQVGTFITSKNIEISEMIEKINGQL